MLCHLSKKKITPRSSRNGLREHTPELRTGCEVKFAPADLSSSVRETSAMGVNGTVPVSKMSFGSVVSPVWLGEDSNSDLLVGTASARSVAQAAEHDF